MCDACSSLGIIARHHGRSVRQPRLVQRPLHYSPRTRTPVTSSTAKLDRVLLDATVHTLDAANTTAQAIGIRDDKIVVVGSDDDVRSLTDTGTEVLDLDGRTVIPGLVDAHMHSTFVLLDDFVDLSPMATPTAELVHDAIAAHASGTGGWATFKLFDPSITSGTPHLDRDTLDRLAPDRPVFILESNAHVAYVNSKAMELAGVDESSTDPHGARYCRDGAGRLTGRLEEEGALLAFIVQLPFPDTAEIDRRILALLDHAASVGATMLHDCGVGMRGPDDVATLSRLIGPDSPIRYRGMLVSSQFDTWDAQGLTPGWGNDHFRLGGIKAWSDGSNQARTGFQRVPYLGTEARGALNFTAEQLAATVDRAHRGGWQIGVHANGDAAIDVTLDAYAAALASTPRADHRHRIEHCSVLHPEQIERMVGLGLSPSFLIGHVRWWGAAFRDRILGPERASLYDPCASALAAGLRISLHSDYNVTPIAPLRYAEDAAARIMVENGEVLNDAERISVEAALRAVTIDAAWQLREDHRTGSIEVGKSADLCVLDGDPFAVEPSAISQIPVHATYRDGLQRFKA